MAEKRLVVIRHPEILDAYLAAWAGLTGHGHGPHILPAARILRMLAYPVQHTILWPEIPNENPPLPGGALVRLPILREATEADRKALELYCDYAASVRAAALRAIGEGPPADQRTLIALTLVGRRKRTRSVLILTESEAERLARDT